MKTISNVQVLRGLAATGVMVAHAAGMLLYGDVPVSLPNVEWGAFGVDVFFVVSGVVMVVASADLFGRPGAVLPFLGRRMLRIVPLYWLASVAFAILLAVSAGSTADSRALARDAVRSMLFVPAADGGTSLLPTGWTLFYEMGFYLCFAGTLPFRRRPALLALALALAALGAVGTAGWLPERAGCFATLQLLEFVAGLAIGEARLSGWRVPPRVGAALACATTAYVVAKAPHMDGWTEWRGLAWGVPAALIVGALALAPDAAAHSRPRRALERLGDASFSIYMVHFPLFWAIGLAIPEVPRGGPHLAQLYVVMLAAVGLPVSLAVHRLVEAPLTLRLQALLAGRGRGRADVPAWDGAGSGPSPSAA